MAQGASPVCLRVLGCVGWNFFAASCESDGHASMCEVLRLQPALAQEMVLVDAVCTATCGLVIIRDRVLRNEGPLILGGGSPTIHMECSVELYAGSS